ncbi:MAG: hypothetical protein ACFFDW_08995 [Candidatus Thorarchaeota archaeon]
MKKSRDLFQTFEQLIVKIKEFEEGNTVVGMERVEIESLIQQVLRLHDKLEKYMDIVNSKY